MSERQSPVQPVSYLFAAVLLLLLFFGLTVGSALQKSPTLLEGPEIARGWAFWRSGRLLPSEFSPLPGLLGGGGLLLEPDLPSPGALNGWETQDTAALSASLLWQSVPNIDRAVFMARFPMMLLGLLLGALVWRWAHDRFGGWGALLAASLIVFSPGVAANARLVTADVLSTTFTVAVLLAWSRVLRRFSFGRLAAVLVLTALSVISGMQALLLFTALALMAVYAIRRGMGRRLWSLVGLLLILLTGLVVLEIAFPGVLGRFVTQIFSGDFAEAFGRDPDEPGYLLGLYSADKPWYGALVVFMAKLPLIVLIVFGLTTSLTVLRARSGKTWDMVLPTFVFTAAVLIPGQETAFRFHLMALVLLCVLSGRIASEMASLKWVMPVSTGVIIVTLLATNALIYPDYLSYYNMLSGGPDSGRQISVAEDLDWGQDLAALADYIEQRGVDIFYLSYYGEADPQRYGLNYLALPTASIPAGQPEMAAFHPLNPPSGLYAISATNLVGAGTAVNNAYGYFATREPSLWIGHSIAIYEVSPDQHIPANSAPWIAVCQHDEPDTAALSYANLTGFSDLRVYTFDCYQSLPAWNGSGWISLPAETAPVVELGTPEFVLRADNGSAENFVWFASSLPGAPASSVEYPSVGLPLPVAGKMELLGYEAAPGSAAPGETVTLVSWWRVRELLERPISFFVLLRTPDNSILFQGDGLGVPFESWQPGLIFAQRHVVTIPSDAAPGDHALVIGAFEPDTGSRLPVFEAADRVIDQIVLRPIQVTASE